MSCRAGAWRILAIVVASLGAVPGVAAARAVRAVVSFKYSGKASESTSGLGSISEEQPSGGFADGQYGTEAVDLSWNLRVHIPVIIDDFGTVRARFVTVHGEAKVVDFELEGTVMKDPLAGCEFGSKCPSPSAPHNQPCQSNLFENSEWAEARGAGGHPEAVIDDGHLIVDMHTPADYNAMKTNDPMVCRANPTSTGNMGLDAFTPPLAFNGNPEPPVNAPKLREYDDALRPRLTLELARNGTRLLSADRFGINWDWAARWAPPADQQIGPDFSTFLDLHSRIEDIKVKVL